MIDFSIYQFHDYRLHVMKLTNENSSIYYFKEILNKNKTQRFDNQF